MVLDFKVNARLVVGMTINFFMPLPQVLSIAVSPLRLMPLIALGILASFLLFRRVPHIFLK